MGEAIASINQRLDATNVRIDMIDNAIRALNNKVFADANLARVRELRPLRNEIEKVVGKLKNKDPDKDGIILAARQAADTLLEDKDLWLYSDLTIKDQFVPSFNPTTGLNELKLDVAKGTMLPEDFKTIPTLEVYASALAAWMAAIEYAGNPGQVNALHGQNLQRHINNLSVRTAQQMQDIRDRPPGDFRELSDKGETLPELLRQQIQGFYVPTTKYPDGRLMCNFSEYVEDGFSRDVKFVGTYEYKVAAAGTLCSVPAGLTKQATMAEGDFERAYGLEVIEELAKGLKRLKTTGSVREAEPMRLPGDANKDETHYLYTVTQDGVLYWHEHKLSYTISTGNRYSRAVHKLTPSKVVGQGWGFGVKEVMPMGQLGIYALREDGTLQWQWHDGFRDGSYNWRDSREIGKGLQGFTQIFAQDEGILYGRIQSDPLGLYWGMTKNYDAKKGAPSASIPLRLTSLTVPFQAFKTMFAGGNGVLYGIGHDGNLYWMRHMFYQSPIGDYPRANPMPNNPQYQMWQRQFIGPVQIGSGFANVTKAFSPGEGNIYYVNDEGSLVWRKHTGWEKGTNTWMGNDWDVIARGWRIYKFIFARNTTSDSGSKELDYHPK